MTRHDYDAIGVETDEISVPLSEDKKTMVADNHGWAGKRYTRARWR